MKRISVFQMRLLAALALMIFCAADCSPFLASYSAEAAGLGVRAELKDDVSQDDVDEFSAAGTRKSNVLFLIEATAAMSFSPKGVMPQVQMTNGWDESYVEGADWRKTKDRFGYGPEEINKMMAQATFGMGALPPAWSGQNLRAERNLYGRDIDSSNNFIKGASLSADIELNRGRYYFPHLDKVNPINNDSYGASGSRGIYRGQNIGLEVGFENAPQIWPYAVTESHNSYRAGYPTGDLGHFDGPAMSNFYHNTKTNGAKGFYRSLPVNQLNGSNIGNSNSANHLYHTIGTGDQIVADYNYTGTNKASAYPYAMVFKDPQYWAAPPASFSAEDLVPNDSRMYQAKLVLWNMLQNRDLFRNVRIGLATTFLSPCNEDLASMSYTRRRAWSHRQDYNGIFKVHPFASNVWTVSFFKDGKSFVNTDSASSQNPNDINPSTGRPYVLKDMIDTKTGLWKSPFRRIQFTNGAMYGPITGQMETHSAIHGQMYPLWRAPKMQSYYDTARVAGVPGRAGEDEDGWWQEGWNDYMAGEKRDRPLYKLFNRASLWVPILDYDHVWTKAGGMYRITQADKIRLWIDGVSDIRSSGSDQDTYNQKGDYGMRADQGLGGVRDEQFHFYRNPEIGIAGIFALPQAIFPDPAKRHPGKTNIPLNLSRQYYYDNAFVWFSKRRENINYRADYRRFSMELDYNAIPRAYFNAGSGEAAGSVLDFFSPMADYTPSPGYDAKLTGNVAQSYGMIKGVSSHNTSWTHNKAHSDTYSGVQMWDSSKSHELRLATDLDDVSFPIRNKCENNWLIVITSGIEPKNKPGEYVYQAWQAIENLYNSTDKKKKGTPIYKQVTMLDKSKAAGRQLTQIDLDEPIRTLVVGMVADPSDPALSKDPIIKRQVMDMRLNITRMAVAGQGGDAKKVTLQNMDGVEYQPFFADDAESLERQITAAISYIERHSLQPAKGAILEAPTLGDKLTSEGSKNKEFDYYKASFRINRDRAWDGMLTRYSVVEDKNGKLSAKARWELNGNMVSARGAGPKRDWRNIRYWVGGSLAKLGRGNAFASMTGLTGANMYGVSGFPQNSAYKPLSVYPAGQAMYDWLQGYDHSYGSAADKNRTFTRNNILSDIGREGVAFVDAPPRVQSLPGYLEWANTFPQGKLEPRIYVQTNGGVLHIVEPEKGREEIAVLPPPSLVVSRLATGKTNKRGTSILANESLEWINVTTGEKNAKSGDISQQRGNAVYILDGPLQKHFFAKTPTGFLPFSGTPAWGEYLLASLGRGGSGLYMMDVTDRVNPKLLWYRERIGNDIMVADNLTGLPVASRDVSGAAYLRKLGFNSPNPVMGVTGAGGAMRNILVVAGGAQYNLNPQKNGTDGAVLVILDPLTGELIRGFDSGTVMRESALKTGGGETGPAPYMGMMVSEPSLYCSEADSAYGNYIAGYVYAADNRGSIFSVAMEGRDANGDMQPLPPPRWKINTLATLQSAADAKNGTGSYSVPFGLAVSKQGGSTWLAGGTADVRSRKKDGGGVIKNAAQLIFAFETNAESQVKASRVYTGDDLQLRSAEADSLPYNPSGKFRGWKIQLEKEKKNASGRVIRYAEYVSAKPMLYNGIMFVPTFIPYGLDEATLNNPALFCSEGARARGAARLYALNIYDGGGWNGFTYSGGKKYSEIANAKISGLSQLNLGGSPRGAVTIDKLGDAKHDGNLKSLVETENDAILTFGLPLPPGGAVNMKPGENIINYWVTY